MENDRSLTFVVAIVALVAIVTVGILGFRATSVAPASSAVPYSPGVPMMPSSGASSGPAENFGGLATEIPDIQALLAEATVAPPGDYPEQTVTFRARDLYRFDIESNSWVYSGYFPFEGSFSVQPGLLRNEYASYVGELPGRGTYYSSMRPITLSTTLSNQKINQNGYNLDGMGYVVVYKYYWGYTQGLYQGSAGYLVLGTFDRSPNDYLPPGTYNNGWYMFVTHSGDFYMSHVTDATIVNGGQPRK